MSLHEEQQKVQKSMNAALSGLQEDPWLAQRVFAETEGEKQVGKKKIGALVLAAILAVAVIGTACAVFSSRIAEYFSFAWGNNMGEKVKGGRIAQIGESVTVGGVVFTLDEIAYADQTLYGIGTARAADEKDILVPYDVANEQRHFVNSEEGQAYIEKAKATGGRMLVTDTTPVMVGVDEGTMLQIGCAGWYDEANGDGTLTFSFEAGDGFAISEGTSYQIRMESNVSQINEKGEWIEDSYQTGEWTVSCVPEVRNAPAETQETARPVPPPEEISLEGLAGYEVTAPAAYAETGTLPVYRATETNLQAAADPAWFNTTGIAEREGEDYIIFRDKAHLLVTEELLQYAEDTGTEGVKTDSEAIISLVYEKEWLHLDDTFELKRRELSGITLEEAQRRAEELLTGLGLDCNRYVCTEMLDMDLERIRTTGAAYEAAVASGDLFAGENHQPHDFSVIPATEEGYYLTYRPLETDTENCSGRYGAQFYVNSRGIVFADVRNQFSRGETAYTPEKLISAEDAVRRLVQEVSRRSRDARVSGIQKVVLNYLAVRAEDKAEGMVFVPVWTIRFRSTDAYGECDFCIIFNATDGTVIDTNFC